MKAKREDGISKWGICSYGLMQVGVNIGICLVTTYGMLYMTDYAGMDAGIIGILIAISKVFDGISDVIAGSIIDRSHKKMGKAKYWIMVMTLPMIVCTFLVFSMPEGWSDLLKYAYFFLGYTLFNAVFYTLYSVANASLPLYVAKTQGQQVGISTMLFAGSTIAGIITSGTYLTLIHKFGDNSRAWQITSLIYGMIFLITVVIFLLSVHEDGIKEVSTGGDNFLKDIVMNLKYLIKDRFFLMQLAIMVLYTGVTQVTSVVLPYYSIRIIGNEEMQALFMLTMSGVVIGVCFAGPLMKKFGMYKMNLYTRIIACIFCAGVTVFALMKNLTGMLVCNLLFMICCGPYLGTVNTMIAEISKHIKLKQGVNVQAVIFSAQTMGTKFGQAFGAAVVGWLLSAAKYDGTLSVQPQSALNMITFLFALAPLIIQIILAMILAMEKVEEDNARLELTSTQG